MEKTKRGVFTDLSIFLSVSKIYFLFGILIFLANAGMEIARINGIFELAGNDTESIFSVSFLILLVMGALTAIRYVPLSYTFSRACFLRNMAVLIWGGITGTVYTLLGVLTISIAYDGNINIEFGWWRVLLFEICLFLVGYYSMVVIAECKIWKGKVDDEERK